MQLIILIIIPIYYMKIAVLFLSVLVLTLGQVSPPVWPQVFTQSFVESYTFAHTRTAGKVHYNSKSQMERVDRVDGQHEVLCGSILPNVSTPCTHIAREKKRYVIHPEKRMCCMCCDQAHGCGVTKRDWLSQAKYQGQEALSGQSFYKWSIKFDSYTDYYYAQKTESKIPRRLIDNTSNRTLDFFINSYSTEQIPDTQFSLPEYCKTTCPSTTICGMLQSFSIKQE